MTEDMGKLFFKAIEYTRHKNRLYGHMGLQQDDGSFIFQDEDSRVGRVYVRVSTGKQTSEIEDSTEQLVQAINQGAPLVGDLPVWLERTPSGELKIVEVDWALALEMVGDRAPGLAIGPHSHRRGFGLEDFVEGLRFEPGLVTLSATGGMNVFVNPIHYSGGMWAGGDFDLSAYQPATANRKWWVVIYVDTETGTLTAETGDELPLSYAPMVETEAAAIPVPAGSLVLGGVVVNDSQTVVDGNTTIIDMRWWGTSSPYYQQLQINGTDYNARKTLNLLSDGSVGFAIVDDAGNDVTELTITASGSGSGSGGGYITVKQIDDAITVNDVGTIRFTRIVDNLDGSVDVPDYYHTIQDNGSDQNQRGKLNFIAGSNVTIGIVDDAGNDVTDVTISATGGAGSGGTLNKTTETLYTQTVLYEDVLGSSGSWDVSSISQDYDSLWIEIFARGTVSATQDIVYLSFNNDTTNTNYRRGFGTGGSASTIQAADDRRIAFVPAATAIANSFSTIRIFIDNYTSTSAEKIAYAVVGGRESTSIFTQETVLHWENTGAINRIAITTDNDPTDTFVAGSIIRIIGVKQTNIVTDVSGGLQGAAYSTDDVSSPPTDAEIETAFGTPATVGAGYAGVINDNGAGSDLWFCMSDGTDWWYVPMTKAT